MVDPANEPTQGEKLEALRSATAFIRMTNDNRLADLLAYWSTLNEYEQGCALGALSQLSLIGIHALAGVRGCSFAEVLDEIDSQITANIGASKD